MLLLQMVQLNVILFFFNLIPVPPLDGSKVFAWVMGPKGDGILDSIQKAGPMAFLVVIMLGGTIISKPASLLIGFIFSSMRSLFG